MILLRIMRWEGESGVSMFLAFKYVKIKYYFNFKNKKIKYYCSIYNKKMLFLS